MFSRFGYFFTTSLAFAGLAPALCHEHAAGEGRERPVSFGSRCAQASDRQAVGV
ncbi:MAG: hypothetical protein AW09_001499 [Candidatus Accumulibacter phosphatis]|uniref:Uncharacterized protein n=1 Tax=Candidatus Accumulibacter phosphatis TaxID=327160 RepID=A0A080M7Y1_9PROT|nr:hypothetical protein [Accumulibacter sp.]KFB73239.1 MAG: hypothetical protein AW09_001499 [Candidatus Accumulibacter phosphatis]HRF11412.1 hypothetical protein [Candidatus Accumulibacter phosphatis]